MAYETLIEEAKTIGLKNDQKVICMAKGETPKAGVIEVNEKKFIVKFPGGTFIELQDGLFGIERKFLGTFGTVLTF